MPEAKTKIEFPEATHEAFAVFADEVEEALPGTHLTFVDKPMFGKPYVIVKGNYGDPWDEWTLILDAGEDLCLGDNNNVWVARP